MLLVPVIHIVSTSYTYQNTLLNVIQDKFLYALIIALAVFLLCLWHALVCCNCSGLSPADADLYLLDIARKIDHYGLRLYPAKVML